MSNQARRVTSGAENKKSTVNKGSPGRISMVPRTIPSQPVVIPTRTRAGGERRKEGTASEVENNLARNGNQHDVRSIPPSVAALLAITSIPVPEHRKRSQRGLSANCLVDARSPMNRSTSSSATSNENPRSLGVLLSPPDEVDSDDMSFESDSTVGLPSSIGSRSTQSMTSLEADTSSWSSASVPSSPGLVNLKRYGVERPKLIRSSSEDCRLDHPLVPDAAVPDPNQILGLELVEPFPVHKRQRGAAKSTFKSHLTASLRSLKSAAVSFSGLSTPIIQQQDDFIARTALSISIPFTDEQRPVSLDGIPDPALRRYLNPLSISPAELHFHHNHHPSPRSRRLCKTSIQLRTIQNSNRDRKSSSSSAHATAPPIFAAHPLSNAPTHNQFTSTSTRQREPRENSAFLRVIVLEMNMRRAGKLNHSAPGRARLWLPARSGASSSEVEDSGGGGVGGGVSRRWVGEVP